MHLLHYSHWTEEQKDPAITSRDFLPGLSVPSCCVPNVKRVEKEAWVCRFCREGSRGRKQQDECLLPPIPHWHTCLNGKAAEELSGFKICTSTEFSSFGEAGKTKKNKKTPLSEQSNMENVQDYFNSVWKKAANLSFIFSSFNLFFLSNLGLELKLELKDQNLLLQRKLQRGSSTICNLESVENVIFKKYIFPSASLKIKQVWESTPNQFCSAWYSLYFSWFCYIWCAWKTIIIPGLRHLDFQRAASSQVWYTSALPWLKSLKFGS